MLLLTGTASKFLLRKLCIYDNPKDVYFCRRLSILKSPNLNRYTMTLNNYAIHTIMLAEDDEDDKIIFQDVLQEIDPKIKVEYVSDGVKLLELMKNFAPDILFLDLDMPFKNGLECLVEIRNNPALEQLPVIVFSSTTRQSNIQTAYEMGAHLFLIKSSAISEYIKALKSILSMNWTNPNAIKEQYCINNRYVAFS